jgi:hypothetical protein
MAMFLEIVPKSFFKDRKDSLEKMSTCLHEGIVLLLGAARCGQRGVGSEVLCVYGSAMYGRDESAGEKKMKAWWG